jgi:hypothetical protein
VSYKRHCAKLFSTDHIFTPSKLKEKLVRLDARQIRERKYLSLSSEARNIGYTLDTLDSV